MTHIQQAVEFLRLALKIKRGDEIYDLEADTALIRHVSVCDLINSLTPLEKNVEITIVFEVPAVSLGVDVGEDVPIGNLLPGGRKLLDG